jgi:hypothetical protein
MSGPIQEEYFDWLCAKAISPYISNYWDLLQMLYKIEFVWVVPRDRNRVEDGLELREYFLNESGWDEDSSFDEPCSVLEVLIAFSGRMSFQTGISVKDCFWMCMENLHLNDFRQVGESDIPVIEDIIHTFVWRTYDYNGYGGLFPLDDPKEDQRKVEIWYEFCAWVEEKDLI